MTGESSARYVNQKLSTPCVDALELKSCRRHATIVLQNGSKVSHFAQGLPDFKYDEEKPYAEVCPTPSSFREVPS